MMKTNTETHYVAQVQEVYDGNSFIRNPYFAGIKDVPYLFPPLSANIIAIPGKLLGLSPIETVMIFRFIITSLLAFLIYLFATVITKQKTVGWVAAPFVLLGYMLVDPHHIINLFNGATNLGEQTFIDYGRPINPQVSSTFFFGYLLSFWYFLNDKKRTKLYGSICALLLGLSFYVYLYTWTFIFTLNGFLVLLFILKKDWEKVKKIIIVSIGAIIVGVPYFLNILEATQHPWYHETSVRFGFVNVRTWNISRLVIGLLILFAIARKKIEKSTKIFFTAVLITAIFVVNEQIITGKYIFNHHYHWYYTTPLMIILIVTILFAYIENSKYASSKYLISVILILFIGYNGIAVQIDSYKAALPGTITEQNYSQVISWLNKNTKKDEVIYAKLRLMDMIPAVTHNNVYYTGSGIYTLVTDQQLIDAYLFNLFLEGTPTGTIREYLEENQDDVVALVYGYKYSFQPGICSTCAPKEVLDELASTYQKLNDKNILEFVKKYPIDYIIWNKKEDPEWNLDKFNFEVLNEFSNEIFIYRFK